LFSRTAPDYSKSLNVKDGLGWSSLSFNAEDGKPLIESHQDNLICHLPEIVAKQDCFPINLIAAEACEKKADVLAGWILNLPFFFTLNTIT